MYQISRTILRAPTTLYIAPASGIVPNGWANGYDSNNGSAELCPFATRQAAWNMAQSTLDLGQQTLTFQLCAGTYTDNFTALGPLLGGTETNVIFAGDYATPDNCIINANTMCWGAAEGATYTVSGFKGLSGGGVVIGAQSGARITFGEFDFGQTDIAHIWVGLNGAVTGNGSEYVISGGAAAHFKLDAWGTILINPCTIWMPNACAFTYFCQAGTGNGCFKGLTFAGPGSGTGSTGQQYAINEGAIVLVGGAGPNYFPGYANSGTCDANSIYQ